MRKAAQIRETGRTERETSSTICSHSSSRTALLLKHARAAKQIWDHVGVFSFEPVGAGKPTIYTRVPVPPDLELSRVLFSACQDLINITPVEIEAPPGPGEEAASLIDE
ncbi:MAG: hypothetical protein ACRDJG_04700 [Actinomycetota bacterium]